MWEKLLAELEKQELASIDTLREKMGEDVSESRIGRDLKALEKEGRVILLRGGAAKLKKGSYDTSLNACSQLHTEEKDHIARVVAELVENGDVAYIDAGRTTLLMVKCLKDKQITIVTTNAMLFSEIAGTQLSCVMVGGNILISTVSIVGSLTDATLQDMYFDKAFIGATGYETKSGVNTPDFREAKKKQIVKDNSRETYFLVGSSKEGRRTMCKAFEITECTIISEKETEFLRNNATYIIAK